MTSSRSDAASVARTAAGGPRALTAVLAVCVAFALGAIAAPTFRADLRTNGARAGELNVSEVVARNARGIVYVEVTSSPSNGSSSVGPGRDVTEPSGTGFVYGREGMIVTARHVVAGGGAIRIRLADGTVLPARYVAGDPDSDVAVLFVDAPSGALRPLTLGDSSRVKVGDGVVAVGSPFGMQSTVTSGIVSAVGRTFTSPDNSPITDGIQTDAAINHGNSGGPLLDLHGNVIGLVSQFMSASGGSNGVGLAVPSNTVGAVVARLLARRAIAAT